jgi:hypothetical protein
MTDVDASIPLSVKPVQLDNPMDVQGKALQLKNLGIQTQQAQQDYDDSQTIRSIYAKNVDPTTGQLNQAGFARDGYAAGVGAKVQPVLGQFLANNKTQAEIGETQAKGAQETQAAAASAFQVHQQKAQAVGQYFNALQTRTDPQTGQPIPITAQDVSNTIGRLVDDGYLDAPTGAQMVRQAPSNDAQAPGYVAQAVARSQDVTQQIQVAKDRHQQVTADTGPAIQYGNRDSISGKVTMNGPTVTKGVSPDTQAGITKDYAISGLNPDGTPGDANAALVKMIGENRIVPSDRLESTPRGQAILAEVEKQYPGYDRSTAQAKVAAARDFTVGKDGASLRSIGTATKHLDMLDGMVSALDNGNTPLLNKLGNTWSTQTGGTAPGNFDAAKDIVGKEVIKGIVAGGGGVGEREEAAAALDKAKTPAQLRGVIATYKTIMGAQQESLLQQRDAAGLPRSTLPNYTEGASNAPGSAPAAPAGAVVPIKSDADYNSLPSGTPFIAPDGSHRIKP